MSKKLTAEIRQKLEGQDVGEIRIVVGFPKDKSKFLHEVYPETADLKDSLFKGYDQRELVINPVSATTRVNFPEATVFHVDEVDSQIGVVLQWSNMKGFRVCNDALTQIAIPELRYVEHLSDLCSDH
jgi:hypothetical protein